MIDVGNFCLDSRRPLPLLRQPGSLAAWPPWPASHTDSQSGNLRKAEYAAARVHPAHVMNLQTAVSLTTPPMRQTVSSTGPRRLGPYLVMQLSYSPP